MSDEGNVKELRTITKLDVPVEKVLAAASKADLESAIVIGWEREPGGDMYFASSIAAGPEVLWLLEMARRELMAQGDADRG